MKKQINIYMRATPLTDVKGRVNYISSPDRQEFLEAVYSTRDNEFWKALSTHCQEQVKYSKKDKACEGREFMCSLDNSLYDYEPDQLARKISEIVKGVTHTENVVALHWNKKGNNYHCHVIVAENQEINQVKEGAVLTKNTYYDADGKRSTKSKCIDPETKELLPGCTLLKKGERKQELVRFGAKLDLRDKALLRQLKGEMVVLQNQLLGTEKFKLFESDGLHIAQQHVGNGLPEEIQAAIEAKNALIKEYNMAVDKYQDLAAAVSETELDRAQDEILAARSEIKAYARTDQWLELIRNYTRKFREKIAAIQKQVVFPENKKRGLAGILASAEKRTAAASEEPQKQRNQAKDNEYNH